MNFFLRSGLKKIKSKAAHSHQLLFSNTLPKSPLNIPPRFCGGGTVAGVAGSGGGGGTAAGRCCFLDFE